MDTWEPDLQHLLRHPDPRIRRRPKGRLVRPASLVESQRMAGNVDIAADLHIVEFDTQLRFAPGDPIGEVQRDAQRTDRIEYTEEPDADVLPRPFRGVAVFEGAGMFLMIPETIGPVGLLDEIGIL